GDRTGASWRPSSRKVTVGPCWRTVTDESHLRHSWRRKTVTAGTHHEAELEESNCWESCGERVGGPQLVGLLLRQAGHLSTQCWRTATAGTPLETELDDIDWWDFSEDRAGGKQLASHLSTKCCSTATVHSAGGQRLLGHLLRPGGQRLLGLLWRQSWMTVTGGTPLAYKLEDSDLWDSSEEELEESDWQDISVHTAGRQQLLGLLWRQSWMTVTGECQCEGQSEGKWCPAGQRWDDDLCGCVCAADCPGSQPLNPDTCLCQCRESPQSCLRQGKRFNPNTCSCYRLPCRKPRRVCLAGFYYSHQVCQCIPNYMRPEWN
ncbi:putative vascular endothelial growth factor C-like, partial [Scophthalmus maximus]